MGMNRLPKFVGGVIANGVGRVVMIHIIQGRNILSEALVWHARTVLKHLAGVGQIVDGLAELGRELHALGLHARV